MRIQNMQLIPPITVSELTGASPTIALSTYKGEVPMSPKIIPRLQVVRLRKLCERFDVRT